MRRSIALIVSLFASTAFAQPKLQAPPAPPQAKQPPPPAAPSGAPWDKSGIKDWTKVPAPTKEPTFKPPVPKRSKLKNGMSLLLIENHALPIVSMAMVVPSAGAAVDPTAKAGLASFTADLLDEGAGDLSAIQIAEEQDRLGASIRAYADVDSAGVSVSTLTKTLEPTVDLVTKIVTQPKFDAKEFERVKGDRMTSLELRRDRPREVAAIMLNAALYGADSAYGHPASGMRETFKDIAVGDVQTFYKERWNPAAMTLIVAGDFDAKALKTKLDATLGAWKPTGAKKPEKIAAKPAALGKRLLLADRKDSAQSDVRIGLVGIDRKDKRYYQLEVLANALGGSFTSRLNNRLREQLGITYGVRAGEDYRAQPGPFLISTAIVTPSTGQGLSETIKILDDLAANDLPKDELEKAKQNLIRALPAQFDTNAATVASYADLLTYGLPDNWYASYATNIKKVNAAQVKAAAKTLIPSKSFVVSIVGDLSKIKADIDKLGFGDALMHDLYGQPAK
ncbi:MAG TPA: pitrilysin family protein [Kofleriaceae bacterium]|nr:pitrilysin family protein [Kofleriaceae bacterium]